MIILPCMKRPDLDAVAGSLAFADYLLKKENKNAKVWLSDKPDGEAQFYLKQFPYFLMADIEEVKAAKEFQLVDLSRADALPDFIDRKLVTRVIDHRFLHDARNDFPNAVIELAQVGAAATQVADHFKKAKIKPREIIAQMLYGAIYSNTLCLKGSITTNRDREAAAWLKTICKADQYVPQQMEARKLDILHDIPFALQAERKNYELSSGVYGYTQLEMTDGIGFWKAGMTLIQKELDKLPERSLLSIIDLDCTKCVLYSNDADLIQRLTTALDCTFRNNIAVIPALMRKEIAKKLEDKDK